MVRKMDHSQRWIFFFWDIKAKQMSGGGIAPFILKLANMVNENEPDESISWTETGTGSYLVEIRHPEVKTMSNC